MREVVRPTPPVVKIITHNEEWRLTDEQADAVRCAIGSLVQPRCPCQRCLSLSQVLEAWDALS